MSNNPNPNEKNAQQYPYDPSLVLGNSPYPPNNGQNPNQPYQQPYPPQQPPNGQYPPQNGQYQQQYPPHNGQYQQQYPPSNNNYQQPPTGHYQQPPNYNQPPNYHTPPNSGYQTPPNSGYQQPPNYNQPPNFGYQQPPNYNQPPNSGYQQPPNSGYQQPPNYNQPPNSNYQQPPNYHYQPPANSNYQQQGPEPLVDGPCTFNRSHKRMITQPFYNCVTCGLVDGLGCCEACARICHQGHQLIPRGQTDCYCDCGAGKVHSCVRCRCLKVPASQAQLYDQYNQQHQIPQCTYMQTGQRMTNQKLYTCVTCRFSDGTCICESCAKVCHYGHDVRCLGTTTGFCDCGAGNLPGMKCRCMNGQPPRPGQMGGPVMVDACCLQ